jgi:hypothetical protein
MVAYFYFRAVDTVINTIDRLFSDMSVTITRPFATNALLQVKGFTCSSVL